MERLVEKQAKAWWELVVSLQAGWKLEIGLAGGSPRIVNASRIPLRPERKPAHNGQLTYEAVGGVLEFIDNEFDEASDDLLMSSLEFVFICCSKPNLW